MSQATLINISSDADQAHGCITGRDELSETSPMSSVKRKAEEIGHSSSGPNHATGDKTFGQDPSLPLFKKSKFDDRKVSDDKKKLLPTHDFRLDEDVKVEADENFRGEGVKLEEDVKVEGREDGKANTDVKIEAEHVASLADSNGKDLADVSRCDGIRLEHDTSAFQFERLPPEVRSMIYKLLFISDEPVRPILHDDRYMEAPGTAQAPHFGPYIAFLRTSSRISAEAADVLYGKNRFLLYSNDYGEGIRNFLKDIGRHNVLSIRNITCDWQHGIKKAHESSKADELFAIARDRSNPESVALSNMLHEMARSSILKFVDALENFAYSSRLEHLTLVCPGTDNPGHPDNNCVEYHDCPGCHQELPKSLVKIRNLKSFTVGDADWHNELEALARLMNADEINVTQLDCLDLSGESTVALQKQGWRFAIAWRDPRSEDFLRVASKRLK